MFICLNPKEESRPVGLVKGRFQVRFAYARAKESQKPGSTGQDFLISRVDESRTTFALCDGVGQAFMGDVAARLVAESLIAWLSEHCEDYRLLTLRETALVASLTAHLNGLTEYATRYIQRIILPSELAKLVREVLEDRRERSGTQTNFVCGFMEASSTRSPNGWVGLFWLGDAKLRVWKGKDDVTPMLEATWDKNEAWSSRHGVIGKIHCFLGNLNEFDRVMAYSDGMDAVESHLRPGMSDEELEGDISQLQARPDSDDISFVELSYGAPHSASNLGGAALAAAMRMRASLDVPRYLDLDGKFTPLQQQPVPQVPRSLPPQRPPTWLPIPQSENSGTVPLGLPDSSDPVPPSKEHPRRRINNLAALGMIGLCLFMMIGAVLVIRGRGGVGGLKATEVNPRIMAPVVENPIHTSTIRPHKTKLPHWSSTPMPSPLFTSDSPTFILTPTETEAVTKTPTATQPRTPTRSPPPKQPSFFDRLFEIISVTE